MGVKDEEPHPPPKHISIICGSAAPLEKKRYVLLVNYSVFPVVHDAAVAAAAAGQERRGRCGTRHHPAAAAEHDARQKDVATGGCLKKRRRRF